MRDKQCGKLIDLLFEAQSLQEDADLPERVLSLGMCIAGKEWKVIAISSTENDELGGGFVSDYSTQNSPNLTDVPCSFPGLRRDL
jgi:hypothetical protein